MKKISYLIVLLALVWVAGCEKDQIKEQGETVEISEYQERFIHEEWDYNADGSLEKGEFMDGLFKALDTNKDDRITNIEWEDIETYYPDDEYGTFNEWDVNNDGRLDVDEFETETNNLELFNKWDRSE